MAHFSDFKDIHDSLGIDTKDLGCVMLDFEPMLDNPLPEDWLYVSPDEKKFWINGFMGDKLHVTLLYGLLKQASEWRDHITQLLGDWQPETATALGVKTMTSNPGDEHICLAAGLHLSDNLMEAHRRLSYLPHIDTFSPYMPHVTLAYVKAENADDSLDILSEWIADKEFMPTYLDLGSDKS